MLNRSNLELLKAAALRGDWKGSAHAYLELVLEMRQSGEHLDISALEWALRLHNAENVAAIVDEMLARGRGGS